MSQIISDSSHSSVVSREQLASSIDSLLWFWGTPTMQALSDRAD